MNKLIFLLSLTLLAHAYQLNLQFAQNEQAKPTQSQNLSQESSGDPTLIIILMVTAVVIVNLIILIFVWRNRNKYKIIENMQRQTYNNKFPNIKFTCFGCCKNPQEFYSVDCYYPDEPIASNPAYIIDSFVSPNATQHQGINLYQCYTCKVPTQSICIKKFGKMRCNQVTNLDKIIIFILIVSLLPMVAIIRFSINTQIWSNIFCLSCGNQRATTSND